MEEPPDNCRRRLAEKVLSHHRFAEQYRDETIARARFAINFAIEAGRVLLEARELLKGEFDDWLEIYCCQEDGLKLSRHTAYNYMRAVRHADSLEAEIPQFNTLKDLYVAAGILPPPEDPDNTGKARPAPLFRLAFSLNGPPPEEWPSMKRREFLQTAKPIAELYARVVAAESAA